jgi:hypothetical protein
MVVLSSVMQTKLQANGLQGGHFFSEGVTLREPLALPDARSMPRKRKKKPLSQEKLLELGRKHFAEDFPNPRRQGCPAKNQLKLLAEKPRKAKESVLNHISSCSPCYREYSGFLQTQKARLSSRVK